MGKTSLCRYQTMVLEGLLRTPVRLSTLNRVSAKKQPCSRCRMEERSTAKEQSNESISTRDHIPKRSTRGYGKTAGTMATEPGQTMRCTTQVHFMNCIREIGKMERNTVQESRRKRGLIQRLK